MTTRIMFNRVGFFVKKEGYWEYEQWTSGWRQFLDTCDEYYNEHGVGPGTIWTWIEFDNDEAIEAVNDIDNAVAFDGLCHDAAWNAITLMSTPYRRMEDDMSRFKKWPSSVPRDVQKEAECLARGRASDPPHSYVSPAEMATM